MFTFMKRHLRPFNEKVEVDGDTLFLDGNLQERDGSEIYISFPHGLGLMLCNMNLTTLDSNGYFQMRLFYRQEMKSGIASLVMN